MDGLTLRMSLNVRYDTVESQEILTISCGKSYLQRKKIPTFIAWMRMLIGVRTCVYVLAEVVSEMSTPVKNP